MYHHYPWSVWRVSQDTLWMNHCLPLSVNLRHNNCLERERALLQHCTCLWCLLPFCHPLPLISRWMPSLLTPQIQIKICLSEEIARTWKLDNWWIQRKNWASTMEQIIVVFAQVNDILQHFRTYLNGGRYEKWVSGLSFRFKQEHSDETVIKLEIRWEFSFLTPGIKACNLVHHQPSMENKRWISSQHSGLCSVTPI